MEESFGEYIKRMRLDRGMSLRDVEVKTGISNAYLSQVERGKRNIPSTKVLFKLAQAYGISMEYLIIRQVKELEKKQESFSQSKLPPPDTEYITTNYEKLSEDGKQSLKDFLQFLIDKEK